MRVISVEDMKQLEEAGNKSGYPYALMMENAGIGIARVVDQRFSRNVGPILGLVGGGNNGGDTLLAMAALQNLGWKTYACMLKKREDNDRELLVYQEAGGSLLPHDELEGISAMIRFSLILDGVTGTGFKPPLSDFLNQQLIQVRNLFQSARWVAVDCPSGMDCTSGMVSEGTIRADLTVCLEAVKDGLLRPPAFSYIGELIVVDLGLAQYRSETENKTIVVSDAQIRKILPERSPFAHKGSFGKALVIGGSENYCGAPILACQSAYAVGTGLVRAALPAHLLARLTGANPEITWLQLPDSIEENDGNEEFLELVSNFKEVNSLVVGPGLGTGKFETKLVSAILFGSILGQQQNALPPIVIDADALNILAATKGWVSRLKPGQVLTPHPGEMARLTGLAVEIVQANRTGIARKYSQEWGQTIVLKGPLTVVAEPSGHVTVIPIASSALAKAGTGDVLAGMIGGYLAQGLRPETASILAAWVHAKAGIIAANLLGVEDSVLPHDLIQAVPKVLQYIRE